jgi:hypothetical protein
VYAVVIFSYKKSIRVIPVKSILIKKNIEKNKTKVCYYNKNLKKKPNFDKTLFKKDEEEGLYKIYIKEVFGKL